jgi:putative FmdB family regulatory protein
MLTVRMRFLAYLKSVQDIVMPIYEYECPQCGYLTEALRTIQSRDLPMCCCRCGTIAQRIPSTFNTLRKAGPNNPSEPPETPVRVQDSKMTGGGIKLEGGSLTLKDCGFKNLRTGISMRKGVQLDMQGTNFDNVTTPIQVTDE